MIICYADNCQRETLLVTI